MNYWQKYVIKKIIHFTPQYYGYRKKIKNGSTYTKSDIYKSIVSVPYYAENGYCQTEFENYPLLKKSDLLSKEDFFISKKVNKKSLIQVSTSGSSGISLNMYKTFKDVIKEEAFIKYAFSLIGKNLKIGVLRGNRPSSGIFERKYQHILLSSYHLSKQTILEYLNVIKKYKINCLHVYPSSLNIFCKYLKELLREKQVELPNLKGILSSSEILSAEMKDDVLELFPNITLVDLYGQTEHVAFALSINKDPYHFFDSYSIVELLHTGMMNGQNEIKEIVGTNINNSGMPLIRYRTEDFVEVDAKGNIIAIIGRSNDFIVNSKKNIVPCIVAMGNKLMENIITSQYYQDTIGELTYRVKVNERFNKKDEMNIIQDISGCFQGLMQVKLEIVDDFEKTKNGKHIRCIQKLDLKNLNK